MMHMTEDNMKLLLDHLQADFDTDQLFQIAMENTARSKDINDYTIKELIALGFIAGAYFTMENIIVVDVDEIDPETLIEITKAHKTAPTSTTDIKKRPL